MHQPSWLNDKNSVVCAVTRPGATQSLNWAFKGVSTSKASSCAVYNCFWMSFLCLFVCSYHHQAALERHPDVRLYTLYHAHGLRSVPRQAVSSVVAATERHTNMARLLTRPVFRGYIASQIRMSSDQVNVWWLVACWTKCCIFLILSWRWLTIARPAKEGVM